MTGEYSRPPTCPVIVNHVLLLLFRAVPGHSFPFEDCQNIAGILAATVDSRDVMFGLLAFLDGGENRLVEFIQGLGLFGRNLEDAEFDHRQRLDAAG